MLGSPWRIVLGKPLLDLGKFPRLASAGPAERVAGSSSRGDGPRAVAAGGDQRSCQCEACLGFPLLLALRRFQNTQRTLDQGEGVHGPPRGDMHLGQAAQILRDVGMSWAEGLLGDRHGRCCSGFRRRMPRRPDGSHRRRWVPRRCPPGTPHTPHTRPDTDRPRRRCQAAEPRLRPGEDRRSIGLKPIVVEVHTTPSLGLELRRSGVARAGAIDLVRGGDGATTDTVADEVPALTDA